MSQSTRLPSYRHHKPSGQAVVTLSGKDFYLGQWKSPESRAEYDRLIAEWIANGRRLPRDSGEGDYCIAELLSSYLLFAKEYYANDGNTTSEFTCIKEAVRPLHQLYARSPAREFGPLALKAVRQKMIERDWCRTHINRQVTRIRRVFKWGVESELVPPSVSQGLQAVAPLRRGRSEAKESAPVTPAPDEHVDAVIPMVARQVAAMIELQRITGARPGEIVIIRPCDIDRSSDVWVFEPHTHKTQYRGSVRVIYFGPQAQEILKPFLLRDSETYCFSPAEAEAERNAMRRENRNSPMTPSQKKRKPKPTPKRVKRDRYDVASYRRAIAYGIKKAGVPHWHPNQLRHNCATRVRRDHGLDVAQIILGHKLCDVTQVYAEVDRERAIEMVSKCG